MAPRIEHELTYVEDADPKGYGDGLEDVYRCACGLTFQANGDIQEAFDHGVEVGIEKERDRANGEVD